MRRSAAKTITVDDNAGGNLTLFSILGTLKFTGLDIIDAAGDLIVGSAADTAAKLAISVPAANILNVLGVVNGESTWSVKSVHDGTAPVTQAFGDAAAAGTALTAAHRDHKHGMPAAPIADHTHAVTGNGATGGGATVSPTVLSPSGRVAFTGVISPTQLLAAANDYAPTNGATNFMWRVTSDASRAVNGISIGQAQGWMICFINANTTAARVITLQHEQAGSTAGNRFDLPNDASVALDPGESVLLIYDGVLSRWITVTGP